MSILGKNTVDVQNNFSTSDYDRVFSIGELEERQIQTSNVNLMFIDPAVQNIEKLIQNIADNTITVVLNHNEDGIIQITQALEYFDSVPSLHLVSHGQAGHFKLGATTLNSSNISSYKDKLETWKDSFTADADTLVYGCNVAGDYIDDGSYSGDPLLGQLSHYTGTDVAASTNFTGSSQQGGDWVLERMIGEIEAGIGFKDSIRESYNAILQEGTSNSNLRIEAEDLRRSNVYRIENNDFFSGGKSISLRGGKRSERGRAVYVHESSAGIYDLKLNYLDESDGTGNIRVLVNNELVDRWSLNRNSGTPGISARNRQVRTINGLELEAGDRITFIGKENRNEFVRMDYFDLEQTSPPPATDSFLEYLFDHTPGDIIRDTGGFGLDTSLINATSTKPTWTDGKVGGALSFNGSTDYVWVDDDDKLDLNNWTIMAWIKYTSNDETRLEVMEKAGAYWMNVRMDTGSLRVGGLFGSESNQSWHYVDTDLPVPENTWVHVAGSFDGNTIRTYINGALNTSKYIGNVPTAVNQEPLIIGAKHKTRTNEAPDAHFLGIIDSVRVYPRALSNAEVRASLD